jgi:hypothetical protein
MHTKLAGHLPLQEMIAQQIDGARQKLAASEKKEDKKEEKKEEKAEKKAGVIDVTSIDDIDKLASALEAVGDMLKEADSVELGGEKRQGGMVLPTQSPNSGKQNHTFSLGHAKHTFPVNQKHLVATKDNPGSATAVPTDDNRAPGGNGAKYPEKGVFKTAAESVMDKIKAAKGKHEKGESEEKEKKEEKEVKEEAKEEKKASAVNFLLDKMAESEQGGLVLSDDKAGNNPKPPSAPARSALQSNSGPVNLKKNEARDPRTKELSQVLSEKAKVDPTVAANLPSASKGGVKTAAQRAFISKIAADPNDPRHELLKKAMAKQEAK